MQTKRILQAVVLMMIVAIAASCAATKEYSSKLFRPQTEVVKDTQAVALRFLELDKLNPDNENWVSTDIIMGRDMAGNTAALDNLAKTFPAKVSVINDTIAKIKEEKPFFAAAESKPDTAITNDTKKTLTIPPQPIAKNDNGSSRNKKIRTEK